ncbi:UNKNOWN [Stylonychia lemnae]|uniref:Uncharacterized protein n=1 Tax=Stylonychia lemnae TaxID=5949 RepID=A0A078AKX4_STYLE|nr:UNKNOWN [Stylonychia lemnae]|eukprot:CDW83020.1 UNKNOWN [Stylonychia lemnae]
MNTVEETRIRPLRSNSGQNNIPAGNANNLDSETVQGLKKKVKWLERRNMEYSQRLRDLNSQKNDAQIQIIDLQRQVQEMASKLKYQSNDMRNVQNIESMKINQLQKQVQELQQIIQLQQQTTSHKQKREIFKENLQPNMIQDDSQITQDQTNPRIQALQVHHMKMPKLRAPQVPLRQKRDNNDTRNQKANQSLMTVRDKSKSLSKPRQIFTNIRLRSESKESQKHDFKQAQIDNPKKKEKGTSRSKSKDKKRQNSKKERKVIKRLTNQVVELSQMIDKVQAQQQQQNQSLMNDQYGILKILQEKMQGVDSQDKAEKFKEQLLKIIQDGFGDDDIKEDRVINPFKENKFKRDKSN